MERKQSKNFLQRARKIEKELFHTTRPRTRRQRDDSWDSRSPSPSWRIASYADKVIDSITAASLQRCPEKASKNLEFAKKLIEDMQLILKKINTSENDDS